MRERDESIERLLRQSRPSLQAQDAAETEACLDAETLAAWFDGGLSGPALELAQSHVADCSRCQSLVGTLGRIETLAPKAAPERSAMRWLGWLVPLTAAAAATALWIAIPRDGSTPATPPAELQRQAAGPNAQEPAPPQDQFQERERRSDDRSALDSAAQPATPPAKSKDESAPATVVSGVTRNEVAKQSTTTVGALSDSVSPAPAPAEPAAAAPAPAARAQAETRDQAAGKSVASLAESVTGAGVEIVSPDPAIRWRIVGSVVQHSTDGGARWTNMVIGVATPLTAGAAPSPSICWLVGRGGVVLLSTDGRSWNRVAFPEVTDLSAIRASDARSASISTADGRTFATTDGGATWVRR